MFLGLTLDQWLDVGFSALIVLATAIVGRWLIYFFLGRILRGITGRTHTTFDDVIHEALRSPLYWLLLVIALNIALSRLQFMPESWNLWKKDLFFVLYLALGSTAGWRLIGRIADWYIQEVAPQTETKLDEEMIPFLRRLASILLVFIVAISLLGYFKVNVSALVTTLGIGSLAIALAAQATLADTISGVVIMVDRPFRINDRIEIQDLNTWGDVVDIGLRSSRIRTRDNRMVIVPNSVIAKSLVVNHSYPDTQYRIQVQIGIAYGSDIELARKTMVDAVRNVEGVLPDRKVEALFLEFGDSALIFWVRWWIESYVDTRQMYDRVNTAVYRALNDAGIEIPNPQIDVHHKVNTEETVNLLRQLQAGG